MMAGDGDDDGRKIILFEMRKQLLQVPGHAVRPQEDRRVAPMTAIGFLPPLAEHALRPEIRNLGLETA